MFKVDRIKLSAFFIAMIEASDFELSIERELTLVKVKQEIDNCKDIDALKNHLKEVVDLNSRYQQIINKLMERQIRAELEKMEQQ